jgi:hypothetical protein
MKCSVGVQTYNKRAQWFFYCRCEGVEVERKDGYLSREEAIESLTKLLAKRFPWLESAEIESLRDMVGNNTPFDFHLTLKAKPIPQTNKWQAECRIGREYSLFVCDAEPKRVAINLLLDKVRLELPLLPDEKIERARGALGG